MGTGTGHVVGYAGAAAKFSGGDVGLVFVFAFPFLSSSHMLHLFSVQRPALTASAAADWARLLIVPRNNGGCRDPRGGHATAARGRRWQAAREVVGFLVILLLFWSNLTTWAALLPHWQFRRRRDRGNRGLANTWTATRPWQVKYVARTVPAGPLHCRRGSEGDAPTLPPPGRRSRWDEESVSPAPSSLPRR